MVGANCRRIRTEIGFSQDQLAAYARACGLKWNAAKVANFEAGRSAPTLATVLAVGIALEHALVFAQIAAPATSRGPKVPRDRRAITLADLLDSGNGLVALNDDVALEAAALAGIGRGEPFPREHFKDKMPQQLLAEQRLAATLGISGERLADVSSQLWGSTFGEERDRRAGVGANQQKKGRISRELRAELEKAITNGND